MPIEIRELVIRVAIEEKQKQRAMDHKEMEELKNRLIKECTEKILARMSAIADR